MAFNENDVTPPRGGMDSLSLEVEIDFNTGAVNEKLDDMDKKMRKVGQTGLKVAALVSGVSRMALSWMQTITGATNETVKTIMNVLDVVVSQVTLIITNVIAAYTTMPIVGPILAVISTINLITSLINIATARMKVNVGQSALTSLDVTLNVLAANVRW